MDSYSYRIDRRPERVGGGWFLQLLQNGVEVAGRVFSASGDDRASKQHAYAAALSAATVWMASHHSATDAP